MKKSIILSLFLALSLTVMAQEYALPKKGDGIHSFLRRYNRDTKEYREEFIRINKNRLGKNNSLLTGVKYQLPPVKNGDATLSSDGKSGYNALFGSKYAEYPIRSEKLRGACFFLVSGHGGPDPGAVAKVDGRTLHEDEYAYDITLRLARELLMDGATVHIIIQDAKDGIRDEKYLVNSNRETCMSATIPQKQTPRLKQRSDKINELSKKSSERYKRSLFIHLDSRSQKDRVDVFFYHHPKSTQGKRLATNLKKTFDVKYKQHQPHRGYSGTVSDRSLYVLNNTNPVGIFVELGNIQNSYDRQRFLNFNQRQAIANWMCQALITDFQASK